MAPPLLKGCVWGGGGAWHDVNVILLEGSEPKIAHF